MWSGLPSEALIYLGLPLVFFNRLALGSGPTPLPCLRVGLALSTACCPPLSLVALASALLLGINF